MKTLHAIQKRRTQGFRLARAVLFSLTLAASAAISQTTRPPNGPGSALTFDGVDDYLSASPTVPTGSGSYTIEGWIRPTTMHVGAIASWGDYAPNRANAFVLDVDGLINYWWGNDLKFFTNNLAGAWHHVAATFDGITRRLLLDGVVVASDRPVGHNATGNNFRIGSANFGQYFSGQMDEVRIWNVARTATQIQGAMRRQLFGSENGLMAYYRFDEGSGTSAWDSTGNAGNTATLMNGPAWAGTFPWEATVVPFAPTVVSDRFYSDYYQTEKRLFGYAAPNGSDTMAYLEWGPSTAYGNRTVVQNIGSGGCCAQWSSLLEGVIPGATYHFRAVASNIYGASFGLDKTFRLPMTHTITNTSDSGPGSLRQAIADSGPGDKIVLPANLSGTVTLTSGELVISHDLDIQGPGASALTISGGYRSRIFRITGAVEVYFSGLSLMYGTVGATALDGGGAIKIESGRVEMFYCGFGGNGAPDTAARGGAIQVLNDAQCDLTGCTLFANQAAAGAAISIEAGQLNARQCTVAGNHASPSGIPLGGAIRVIRGSAQLTACTVASNSATAGVAGIVANTGTCSIRSCVVAGNTGSDVRLVTSEGYNLVAVDASGVLWQPTDLVGTTAAPIDPRLGSLRDNGGPTSTMALLPDSRAIDSGDDALLASPYGYAIDQRGLPRLAGCHVDIGACELAVRGPIVQRIVEGRGSLRDAIACAKSGDVITFAPYVTNVSLTFGELVISNDIAIQGPGPDALTVSGHGLSRLFRVDGGRVRISGLTLAGGQVIGGEGNDGVSIGQDGEPGLFAQGGAILNSGNLTVENCRFHSNIAHGGDGGNGAGDGRFFPPGAGGAGGAAAGGAIANLQYLELINCSFHNNLCQAGSGGGGAEAFNHVEGRGANGGNGGYSQGAAVLNTGTLAATNCVFYDNTAFGGGGGYGGNSARTAGDGGPGGDAAAGAISSSTTFSAVNCTFSGNRAIGGNGGAAGFGGLSDGYGGLASSAYGGAIIAIVSAEVWLIHCTIAGNQAIAGAPGPTTDFSHTRPPGSARGGAIFTFDFNVAMWNTVVAVNFASANGPDIQGAVRSSGGNFVSRADGSSGFTATDRLGSREAPLDPRLAALGDYGGPTFTMPPLRGSPLIDAGDDRIVYPRTYIGIDQRGGARHRGAHVDIGAVEVGSMVRITAIRDLGDRFSVSVQTEPGFPHRLESNDALGTGPWTPFGPVVATTAKSATIFDARYRVSNRFYRIAMIP